MPISRVPITLLLLVVAFVATEAASASLSKACGADRKNATEFAPNSTYQSNLNRLLSSLSANATGAFRNSTAGNGSSDAVYGLYLCRGDVAADVCEDCVATARRDVVRDCNRVRSAVIWYDECMLRYSNESFFSAMAEAPRVRMWNTGNVSDVSRFMALLGNTTYEVKTRAATDRDPPEKFATEEKTFTGLQTLYTLVQCTPDLRSGDCDRCLSTGIARLPDYGSQGGRVLMPSCVVRYELYPFYNETSAATEAPPPKPVLRPAPPPPVSESVPREKKKTSSTTIIAIVVPIVACVVLFLIVCAILRSRAKKKYHAVEGDAIGNEITTVESLQFDLRTIEAATDNFSDNNKIGEGGFGAVYKGILSNGREIAVKRLSKDSGQGIEEFKNEAVLVAKLQHRNLVRLLGFCLERGEKILVYEFVPNKSLNYFLFDPTKRGQLDWSRCYKISGGIARGILYLHEDSRLRIIHRDLKASNILLDVDMNPKISDFGMARIFGVDQTQGNTNRIVGTYGYMAPEYALHGNFSVKSDVFGFGVLILEIISGKKNNNFYQTDGAQDLLSYAWNLWRDGTPLELMDPTLRDNYSRNEVLRCIHIGLLCVQEDDAKRPTMATVVLMLSSYSVTLPAPEEPGFFIRSGTESDFRIKDTGLGGGRVLRPSCNLRYESGPFYESRRNDAPPPTAATSPLTPVLTNSTTVKTGNGIKTTKTVINAIVPAISVMLAVLLCY